MPLDIDPSPLAAACSTLAKNLPARPGNADRSLEQLCLARRCLVWRETLAASEHFIVELNCWHGRRVELDTMLQSALARQVPNEDEFAKRAREFRADTQRCAGMY